MGKINGKLRDALDSLGATLKREKKHLVWELPNGRTFVTAKSPSDHRAEKNALTDLEAISGVAVVERRKASPEVRAERRQRPGRHGEPSPKMSALGAALIDTGIVEQQLRRQIAELERAVEDLATQNASLAAQLDALNRQWFVRFARWIAL